MGSIVPILDVIMVRIKKDEIDKGLGIMLGT